MFTVVQRKQQERPAVCLALDTSGSMSVSRTYLIPLRLFLKKRFMKTRCIKNAGVNCWTPFDNSAFTLFGLSQIFSQRFIVCVCVCGLNLNVLLRVVNN